MAYLLHLQAVISLLFSLLSDYKCIDGIKFMQLVMDCDYDLVALKKNAESVGTKENTR